MLLLSQESLCVPDKSFFMIKHIVSAVLCPEFFIGFCNSVIPGWMIERMGYSQW